ncbi:BgTH12-02716 [Blumeria graminis f. sp. triticale]|uniref:BgTH12-02716 n=1 Tax=Blumeria graminis f. sp. triticale TaxID=1689686 RepID=A0A9W4GGN2_BLUGR|nr:BgTH12-02716 [Blumeria graminis f. sp. triticale]
MSSPLPLPNQVCRAIL